MKKIKIKKMRNRLIIIILLVLINSITVFADNITITRDIPDEIKYGDELKVSLYIKNNLNEKRTFEITEIIPSNVDLIQPAEPSEKKFFNAVEISFLKWAVELKPGEKKAFSYVIKPNKIGEYAITSTEVIDPVELELYSGIKSQFNVLCIKDNICNLEIGENFLTCPLDCSTGLQDGICNAIFDNICDADCTKDPDCKAVEKRFNIYYLITPIITACIIFLLIYLFKKPTKPRKEQPKAPDGFLYS